MLYKLAAQSLEKEAFIGTLLKALPKLESVGAKALSLGEKGTNYLKPKVTQLQNKIKPVAENAMNRFTTYTQNKIGYTPNYKQLGVGLAVTGLGTYGLYRAGKALLGSKNPQQNQMG